MKLSYILVLNWVWTDGSAWDYILQLLYPPLSLYRVPGCGQMGQPGTTPTGIWAGLVVMPLKLT